LARPRHRWSVGASPREPPTACSRAPGAAGTCCATGRHDALNPDRRQVHYAWHPLYGHTVVVCREIVRLSVAVAECRLPGQEDRSGLTIPRWMFDRAACSVMHLEEQPRVRWQALADLRELLNAAAHIPGAVVQVGHPSFEGDAHASSPSIPSAEPTGSVHATAGSSDLAVPAPGDSAAAPAPAGSDAAIRLRGRRGSDAPDGGDR
jgi:hypothetical protein